MKKLACIILLLSLFWLLAFPCFASRPIVDTFDYRQYISYGKNILLKYLSNYENFVSYEQVTGLGRFIRCEVRYNPFNYSYILRDKSGTDICLSIHPAKLDTPSVYDSEGTCNQLSVDDLIDPKDVRNLKYRPCEQHYSSLSIGKLNYHYQNFLLKTYADEFPPRFMGMEWEHGGNVYYLYYLDTTNDDSLAKKNTPLGRLLNLETAEDALAELMADIDRGYAYEYVFAVVMAVVLVLAVLGAAIALPIVIVKRKRKKKAALAGGGEDGMDDAGEDVDSANKSDSSGEETDSGGAKTGGGEDADISRDDTVPNPPTDPG